MSRRASALLANCQTVYHIDNLRVNIAEKLWQTGFHDIDVHDEDGRTPLMLPRFGVGGNLSDMVIEIEVCSWLIQKGAKLHRPQDSPLDYDPDRSLTLIELPPATRALHYVAANVGWKAGYLASLEFVGRAHQSLQDYLGQLSAEAKSLPSTITSDTSPNDCVCACSSQGCLASTMMLKTLGKKDMSDEAARAWFGLVTGYLIDLVGPPDSCWDRLAQDIIRFRTFQELELRHTRCRWSIASGIMTELESEERMEIRDEDHEKIELLESLLREFEEKRGDQDLMAFLGGYWATRMDEVLQEQEGRVNKENLREIGVVLH